MATSPAPALVQFAQKAVIRWGERILLVRKSESDPYQPGKWELPGGRLSQGESPDEALIREIREEVGLEIRPGRPLAIWSWRLGDTADAPTVVAVARLCEANSTNANMLPPDGGDFLDCFGWFTINQVITLDLISNDRDPITQALYSL